MGKTGVIAILAGLLVMLFGCGVEDAGVWEYVTDGQEQVFSVAPKYDIALAVPAGAELVEAFSGEGYQFYAGEDGDLTITTQILQAETPELLLKELTGQAAEKLTVITTWQDDFLRYDVSWVCAGEEGLQVCRGVVLDDGSHYYAVTTAAPEAQAQGCSQQIAECLSGVRLTENMDITVTAP